MTENVSREIMEPFENSDCVPLEKLKLKVKTDGVTEYVDALSNKWADDRYFLNYEAPDIYNKDGSEIIGAKERWTKIVHYMINDLKWLLSLPFFRFWSNIIHNTSILDSLVSLLQEAPPFYALEDFPNCPEMLELLETVRYYVLVVFTRLVTNKESPTEYISRPFLGNLLYEKYIFTVPIIFDLCQLYGRENEKVTKKILQCLFELEPKYNSDLQKAVPCLMQALENVESKFGCSTVHDTSEALSLSAQNRGPKNLTLLNLEDMVLYVLDIFSTTSVFLKNYSPAVSIFHREDFMSKIVSIYESTIPEMYKNLDKLGYNDENIPKYIKLKHLLDVTRIEMLNLFRMILYNPVQIIQDNLNTISEADVKEQVEEYFTFLTYAISEKEFITDYDQFYPVESDLKVLSTIYPELDVIKCDFILQSIRVTIGKPNTSTTSSLFNHTNEAVAGPSGIQNRSVAPTTNANTSNKKKFVSKNSVELVSLISEVKDILYDLDERFIEMCLEYYNFDTASVINAVLEDNLPSKLKEFKDICPGVNDVPPDYREAPFNDYVVSGIENLSLFSDDDDNVPVKTREEIEVPKDYILKNYSLVADDYDYEDEYDDTYDNFDVRGAENDADINSKPFTTPRVLLEKQKVEPVDETDSEEDDTEAEQNGRDHFIQNPAELRAKAEERRQAMRGGKAPTNVTGKPKGQGQEKDVLHNRQHKNVHKASRANHNRRSGAQWKRNRGMIPS
ncbi:activating signal cointegrator 1 complex subunit 2 [Nomia melanderi]|uniref:activating signal cointegrator 1 complex subunit 2 n=1 Tax=Nomia melanderi TaxID=2448451 RepID=UPI003FCE5A9B